MPSDPPSLPQSCFAHGYIVAPPITHTISFSPLFGKKLKETLFNMQLDTCVGPVKPAFSLNWGFKFGQNTLLCGLQKWFPKHIRAALKTVLKY